MVQSLRDAMLAMNQREAYEFTRASVCLIQQAVRCLERPMLHDYKTEAMLYEDDLRGDLPLLPEDSHHWQVRTRKTYLRRRLDVSDQRLRTAETSGVARCDANQSILVGPDHARQVSHSPHCLWHKPLTM